MSSRPPPLVGVVTDDILEDWHLLVLELQCFASRQILMKFDARIKEAIRYVVYKVCQYEKDTEHKDTGLNY